MVERFIFSWEFKFESHVKSLVPLFRGRIGSRKKAFLNEEEFAQHPKFICPF